MLSRQFTGMNSILSMEACRDENLFCHVTPRIHWIFTIISYLRHIPRCRLMSFKRHRDGHFVKSIHPRVYLLCYIAKSYNFGLFYTHGIDNLPIPALVYYINHLDKVNKKWIGSRDLFVRLVQPLSLCVCLPC